MVVDSRDRSLVPISKDFEPFPLEEINQSLAEAFEKAVQKYSDCIAIRVDERDIPFRELDEITNRLANRIVALLGEAEEPVAILVEQGAPQIIAILSTLKAGKIYAVIDLSNPPEQLSAMIRDLGSRLTITESAHASMAGSVSGSSAVILELDKDADGDEKVLIHRSPDAIAAVYYTSGSTGQPKGVIRTHRDLLHNPRCYVNLMRMTREDRQASFFSCSFAMSIRPIFSTLLRGGAIHPYNLREKDIRELASWLDQNKITVIGLTPGVLRQFMGNLSKDRRHFPTLRFINTIGEPLQVQDVKLWQILFYPESLLGYSLGSTEAGVITWRLFRQDTDITEGNLHVGYPLYEKEVLIVDDEHRPLPAGQKGEIAIRSQFLSRGYWNKPGLTEAIFQKDASDPTMRIYYSNDVGRLLPDGGLEHLGRKDSKVKVHGYLVDTRDVEYALYETLPIKSAAVAPRPARHDPHQVQLVAYIVPEDKGLTSLEARNLLAASLPAYMVPSLYVFLDEIPITANGKVDWNALPEAVPSLETSMRTPPSSETQEKLLTIWKKAFGLSEMGVDDNFFEIGGDSLIATVIFVEIERAFGKRYPLNVLLQHGTIRQLADFLHGPGGSESSRVATLRATGTRPPLFLIPGGGADPITFLELSEALGGDQPVYSFQDFNIEAQESIYVQGIVKSAEEFIQTMKTVQPQGPYHIAGHSFGGIIAFEMARQLSAAGEQVGLLGILDSAPPVRKRPRGTLKNRYLTHALNLNRLDRRGKIEYVSERLKKLLGKIGNQKPFQKFYKSRLAQRILWQDPMRFVRGAVTDYNPTPYQGKAVVYRVTQRPLAITWDFTARWVQFILGGVAFHDVPGEHRSIIKQPNVSVLAGFMKEDLDQFNREQ